jgi:membrane-anchored protein YejM (alkaline phosphatase superfamily)
MELKVSKGEEKAAKSYNSDIASDLPAIYVDLMEGVENEIWNYDSDGKHLMEEKNKIYSAKERKWIAQRSILRKSVAEEKKKREDEEKKKHEAEEEKKRAAEKDKKREVNIMEMMDEDHEEDD